MPMWKSTKEHDNVMTWQQFRISGPLWGEPRLDSSFSSQRNSNALLR